MGRKLMDLKGKRFGKLIAIEPVLLKQGYHGWKCNCDCGAEINTMTASLNLGRTTSCGCLRKENAKSINKSHGGCGTPLYDRWLAMRNRCKHNLKYYVNRGITICPEWDSFEKYKEDMGQLFTEHCNIYGVQNTTMDRIDPNKGYFKENCRWATMWEQNSNTRQPFKIKNYKQLNLFLKELNKFKNSNLHITEEDYLSVSYKIRNKIYNFNKKQNRY